MLRVEGQEMLQPLDDLREDKRNEAKDKHRACVFLPTHFLIGADTAAPVNDVLERSQESERAFEHLRHVDAQGLYTGQKHDEEDHKL
jgi:hypothetical protein